MDRETFGTFYDETVGPIYRFLYYKTLSREVAEDLTSATYLKAFEHLHTFNDRGDGSFRAWLYAIARNTYTDYLRKRPTIALPDDIEDATVSAHRAETSAEVALALRALQQLSEQHRDIVILRLWEDRSFKEIARSLGKTEVGCKMAYHRALRQLQATFV